MKRLLVALTVSGLVVALAAAPAVAQKQDIKARGYFGIGGGVSMPIGDYGDGVKTGWLVNAIGGFTTSGGIFGARADVMWAQNGFQAGGGRDRMLGLNADVVLTPGHRPNNVHPYFLAGAGIYNVNSSGTSGGSATKPAFNIGAGVQIHTGHRTDIFFEARFVSIRTPGSANLIPIVAGLRWGGI